MFIRVGSGWENKKSQARFPVLTSGILEYFLYRSYFLRIEMD